MAKKRRRRQNLNNMYVYDSMARKLEAMTYDTPERRAVGRRNKRRAAHKLNLEGILYTLIVLGAIGAVAFVLTSYLNLQTDITSKQRNISKLESQLSDLKLANDEEYARIMGAVDLEKIKQIAMEDLGMTYPAEGQMVAFIDNESDYVRQYSDIPNT